MRAKVKAPSQRVGHAPSRAREGSGFVVLNPDARTGACARARVREGEARHG